MVKISHLFLIIISTCWGFPACYAADWHKICQDLDSGKKFLVQSEKGDTNFLSLKEEFSDQMRLSIPTKEIISFGTDFFQNLKQSKILVKVWSSGKKKWEMADYSTYNVQKNLNECQISVQKEGFYKIIDSNSGNIVTRLLVIDNISKSLRRFLVEMKKDAEGNPDKELYKSSIFVSKINQLFQEVKDYLTPICARGLCQVVRDYQILKKDECPELIPGLYKFNLRRFPGSQVIRYTLKIPENYTPNSKIGLIFYPDFRGIGENKNFENFISLWCQTDCSDYFKEEFSYILKLLKRKLSIDEKRINIVGKCYDGINAIGLALQYPDLWAGCYASLGNSKRELAINAYSMHVRFSKANFYGDELNKYGYYNFMAKCFEYSQCPSINCDPDEVPIKGSSILSERIKNDSPNYIQYRTDSLKRGKSFWISIDSRKDEGLYADIKAKIIDNLIYINAKNVASYSIWLEKLPINENQISIIEVDILPENRKDANNNTVFCQFNCEVSTGLVESVKTNQIAACISPEKVFKRAPQDYLNNGLLKSSEFNGGINDLFAQRFAVVCPYIKDEKSVYQEFALKIASGAPCYTDFKSAGNIIETHNIVYIGDFDDFDKLPDKYTSGLPYKINQKNIIINKKVYSNNQGLFSLYPNPFRQDKYIGFFVCNSRESAFKLPIAFMELKKMPEIDLGLFECVNGRIEWPFAEKFDFSWNLHGFYSDVIAEVKETPEWKWKAWRADVLRKQIKADVGIFENCFNSSNKISGGTISKHDIHRCFKNTWIVKIQIKGDELKEMLTAPFKNKLERKLVPEISGISFVKTNKPDQIWIGDINPDKTYSLVCPEKCLNGTRIGFCPKEYKIVDDGFAVDMILDYLESMEVGLGEELESQEIKII